MSNNIMVASLLYLTSLLGTVMLSIVISVVKRESRHYDSAVVFPFKDCNNRSNPFDLHTGSLYKSGFLLIITTVLTA